MADKKISELTGAGALTGTEEVPIVQGGVTVKTTTQDIADLGGSTRIPKTASYTAVNSEDYANNGTITVTDPTGVANLGYTVLVVSGTTTINSVAYTEGDLVYRFFDGSTWESYLINGGGDFIPLSGTEVGSPVTGDIEIQNIDGTTTKLYAKDPNNENLGVVYGGNDLTDENISVALFQDLSDGGQILLGIGGGNELTFKKINSDTSTAYGFSSNSGGIVGYDYYGLNYQDNQYIQKRYVDGEIKTSSFSALIGRRYNTNGTITVTDPPGATNKGYIVFVVSGTTTIDGVGYTANKLVYRFYNGTSWTSTVINGVSTSNFKIIDTVSSSAVTGTTAISILKTYLIPANTFTDSEIFETRLLFLRTGTAGLATIRQRIGTSNIISGTVLSQRNVMGNTELVGTLIRRYVLKGGFLYAYNDNVDLINDDVDSINALSSVAFDHTIDNYLLTTIQLSNSADSILQDSFTLITL